MSATASAFTTAVRKSGCGKTQEKRDFLSLSSSDGFIKKHVNNSRQSCTAVFLDQLPHDMVASLKDGELL